MNFDEKLKTVITALSDSITNETLEKNHEVLLKLKNIYKFDESNFLDTVQHGLLKFDMLFEEIFEIPEQKNSYIIKFIANGLFEHFHQKRVRKLEGFACCADKSSYIARMTLRALKTRKNLSLYADYQHVEQITENKEQQAYWSPTSVKDTDEAIRLFWDWYNLNDEVTST